MKSHMARLEGVSAEQLEAALDAATGKKETMRLLVALIYKRGPSVPMIAEWVNIRPATIYRWFDRMEEYPLDEAVRDRPKPGRPRKLSDDQHQQLRAALSAPPTDAGFECERWTVSLARRYIETEFDVEYSKRHIRRLLRRIDITIDAQE